jgi:hypothetical protein
VRPPGDAVVDDDDRSVLRGGHDAAGHVLGADERAADGDRHEQRRPAPDD